MFAYRHLVLMLAFGAFSCSERVAEPPTAAQGSGGGAAPVDAGGHAGGAISLQPVGTPRGATSVDATGPHAFLLPVQGASNEVVEGLRARAKYMNEQREITGASVEAQLGRTPAESRLAVTAEKPLAEDTWYWLVVEHDEGLRVLDPDLADEGRWYTHFYTGSAPRVIRVEVPVGAKQEDPYAITLSEPVDVGAIVQQNFLVSAGKAVAGCVLQGVECWGAQTEWRTEIVFFRAGLPAFQPELEVRLPNALTGNKSVGQTKNVSKHTATPDGVSVTLDGWKERAGVHTWVDIIPPPLP